jgi:3-hydroxybutyryl-CoA dehydrogenase
VAAMAGHSVVLYDTNHAALEKAKANLQQTLQKLVEKGKIANAQEILDRYTYATELTEFASCKLIIEAIIENLEVKRKLFGAIEQIVKEDCVLASNTSSLSITSNLTACLDFISSIRRR